MLCRSADALHKKSYLTTEQDNALLLMVQAALGRLVSAPRRSAEMKVAPAAYISLTDPAKCAGSGDAEVRCAPTCCSGSLPTLCEASICGEVEAMMGGALQWLPASDGSLPVSPGIFLADRST